MFVDKRSRKAVGVFPPKGGDTYADYFDIPYRADYSNDSNSEETQQPPLGQVTVVELKIRNYSLTAFDGYLLSTVYPKSLILSRPSGEECFFQEEDSITRSGIRLYRGIYYCT